MDKRALDRIGIPCAPHPSGAERARVLKVPSSGPEAERSAGQPEQPSNAGRGTNDRVTVQALGGRRDFDAHAHVFMLADPMVRARRYTPEDDAPLETWLGHLDRHGLQGGVLVQPSFLGTDNSRVLASVAQARARGYETYASVVIGPETSAEALRDLRRAHVVSVRLNAVGREPPALDRSPWAPFLERLLRSGIALEVHADWRVAIALLPTIREIGTWCVLDHYALAPTAEALARVIAGAGERVSIKASAPYRLRGRSPAMASAPLTAALRHLLPPERILYGSDWPHTQHEDVTFERAWNTVIA